MTSLEGLPQQYGETQQFEFNYFMTPMIEINAWDMMTCMCKGTRIIRSLFWLRRNMSTHSPCSVTELFPYEAPSWAKQLKGIPSHKLKVLTLYSLLPDSRSTSLQWSSGRDRIIGPVCLSVCLPVHVSALTVTVGAMTLIKFFGMAWLLKWWHHSMTAWRHVTSNYEVHQCSGVPWYTPQ